VHLDIDVPRRLDSRWTDAIQRRWPLTDDARVPGILLACKQLRTEALPAFSRQVTPRFHNVVSSNRDWYHIPHEYLQYVQVAEIMDGCSAWPGVEKWPSLEKLVLRIDLNWHPDWYPTITGYDALAAAIVEGVMAEIIVRFFWDDSEQDTLKQKLESHNFSFNLTMKLEHFCVACPKHPEVISTWEVSCTNGGLRETSANLKSRMSWSIGNPQGLLRLTTSLAAAAMSMVTSPPHPRATCDQSKRHRSKLACKWLSFVHWSNRRRECHIGISDAGANEALSVAAKA
jgi:hypothetical protein